MQSIRLFCLIAFLLGTIAFSQEKSDEFPILKGPYLGQKPPGMTPEVFALGIVTNTDLGETCPAFSPDGKRFVFMRFDAREWDSGIKKYSTLMTELINGRWTKPAPLPLNLNTEYSEFDLQIAPDESYIVFVSNRPGWHDVMGNHNDLYVSFRRMDGSWTEPKNLGEEVNTVGGVALTLTYDGKYLLFTGKGKDPNSDIY